MPKGVTGPAFGDPGGSDCDIDGPLNEGLVEVVAPFGPILSVCPSTLLGEHPLPIPLGCSVGVLLFEGRGKEDSTPSLREVALVQSLDRLEVAGQLDLEALRKHCAAVLATLALADHDLAAFEVQILNPEGETLAQPEARAVKQGRNGVVDPRKLLEYSADLGTGEDDGNSGRTLGSDHL